MGWDNIIALLPTYGLLGIYALVTTAVIIILDHRVAERDELISKLRDERAERNSQVINENTQTNRDLIRVVEGLSHLFEAFSNRRRG